MNDLRVCFPATLKMELMIINDDTGQVGTVTVGMGIGEPASVEAVRTRIKVFEQDEMPKLAPGFRLPNRREFLEHRMSEKAGMQVAVPSQERFDD